MKKTITILSIAGFLFFTTFLNAQSLTPVHYATYADTVEVTAPMASFNMRILPDNTGQKFILEVDNPMNEKLNISISTLQGEKYRENTKAGMVRKRFDMAQTEDGDYKVMVSNGRKTITKNVQLITSVETVRNMSVN